MQDSEGEFVMESIGTWFLMSVLHALANIDKLAVIFLAFMSFPFLVRLSQIVQLLKDIKEELKKNRI